MTGPTREPSDEKVREWAALADAASEGPWHVLRSATQGGHVRDAGRNYVTQYADNEDASFIAAAREAVPALAAALRETRAELAEMRERATHALIAPASSVGAARDEEKQQ